MKARLNLTIDEQLLAQIKQYAKKNDTNVSEMVEGFFRKTFVAAKHKNVIDLIESIDKPKIASDTDLKELYYKEKAGKYGM